MCPRAGPRKPWAGPGFPALEVSLIQTFINFAFVTNNPHVKSCAGDQYVRLDIEDELGYRKDNEILQAAHAFLSEAAGFHFLFFFDFF
jgi:hypothetical protein